MRSIALNVHRDFCEVAVKDESGLRLADRIKTSLRELELFTQRLAPDDQLALEHLEAWVGERETEATHPMLPDTVVPGRITVEWLEGEKFLLRLSARRSNEPADSW